jgi:hypothetical protein
LAGGRAHRPMIVSDPSARLVLAVVLYPVVLAGANPASRHPLRPVLRASIAPSLSCLRVAVGSVTFVPFRPGSPRAERKLRDPPPETQIDTRPRPAIVCRAVPQWPHGRFPGARRRRPLQPAHATDAGADRRSRAGRRRGLGPPSDPAWTHPHGRSNAPHRWSSRLRRGPQLPGPNLLGTPTAPLPNHALRRGAQRRQPRYAHSPAPEPRAPPTRRRADNLGTPTAPLPNHALRRRGAGRQPRFAHSPAPEPRALPARRRASNLGLRSPPPNRALRRRGAGPATSARHPPGPRPHRKSSVRPVRGGPGPGTVGLGESCPTQHP